jgi:hypothetical protein
MLALDLANMKLHYNHAYTLFFSISIIPLTVKSSFLLSIKSATSTVQPNLTVKRSNVRTKVRVYSYLRSNRTFPTYIKSAK